MRYKINDLSKKYNISPHTLRYYAKEGLFPFVERDENNVRIFKEEDLKLLEVIECLKKTGMPIKKIKVFVNWCVEGDSTLKERNELFKEHEENVEAKIAELSKELEFLKYKRWFYDNASQLGTDKIFDLLSEDEIPEEYRFMIEDIECE